MKRITPIYIALIILSLIVLPGTLQQVSAQSHNEKVTIEGAFKPSIQQFNKVYLKPETPESVIQPIQTDITTLDRPVHAKAELETLSPLNPRTYESNEGYQNFLLAALGSRLSPLFLYEHSSNLTDETAIGVSIRHFSSWTDIPDYAPSDFMNNRFGLRMANNLGTHMLKSSVGYQYDTYRYYGFKPNDYPGFLFTKKELLQRYQTISLNTQLNSTETDLGYINHVVALDYQYFFDNSEHTQHKVQLSANLRRDHDWFDFEGRQSLGLDLQSQFYISNDSLRSSNHLLAEATPYLQLNGDFYQLKIGLKVDYQNDNSPNIWMYPIIKGNLFVFEKKLEFYAGTGGGMERFDYRKLVEANPFVSTIVPERWQNTRFEFDAGIRTSAIQSLDLHVGIRYKDIDNTPYFITDSTAFTENKFTLVYDKTKQFSFIAEAAWHSADRFGFEASLQYHTYQTDSITKAWHKPELEAAVGGYFKLLPKLKINAGLNMKGHMYAPTYLNGIETIHQIDGWADLQTGADYRISDQFSIYASLHNLLNKDYQLFYQYPVQGIQLFGGIKVRF